MKNISGRRDSNWDVIKSLAWEPPTLVLQAPVTFSRTAAGLRVGRRAAGERDGWVGWGGGEPQGLITLMAISGGAGRLQSGRPALAVNYPATYGPPDQRHTPVMHGKARL